MRPLFLSLALLPSLAAEGTISLEATGFQTRRNDVRKPALGGTDFSFRDLLGSGPTTAFRVEGTWTLNNRHSLRFLHAPFEVNGVGRFTRDVVYQGTTFKAGQPVEGTYRFNSTRATWRYRLDAPQGWTVQVGATAKIRDAKVQLVQGSAPETKDNLGFVPLAHLAVIRQLTPVLSAHFDLDALAGGPGRAVDGAVLLRWQATSKVFADVGYRLLEGGADTDELYTWARLDGWRVGVGIRF